jgi:hypothetical protein
MTRNAYIQSILDEQDRTGIPAVAYDDWIVTPITKFAIDQIGPGDWWLKPLHGMSKDGFDRTLQQCLSGNLLNGAKFAYGSHNDAAEVRLKELIVEARREEEIRKQLIEAEQSERVRWLAAKTELDTAVKKLKWQRKDIVITTAGGVEITVLATCYGNLAVHKAFGNNKGWVLTDLKTLKGFGLTFPMQHLAKVAAYRFLLLPDSELEVVRRNGKNKKVKAAQAFALRDYLSTGDPYAGI